MKILSLILLPIILISQDGSSDSFIFQPTFLEDKIYISSTILDIQSEMDFQGDQEVLQQIRNNGMEFPIKVNQYQKYVMRTETFLKDENGFVPFIGTIDSSSSSQLINNILQPQNQAALDSSFKMSGVIKGKEMIIEKLEGNNIQPQLKETLKQTISQMLKSIKYPEDPLKIGDSFSQTVPFSMPVEGIMVINMIITIDYTLKEMNNLHAIFDIEQKFQLSSDSDETKITMDGNGSGKIIYDKMLNQMASMETWSKMKIEINTGPLTVITNADTKNQINTLVMNKH